MQWNITHADEPPVSSLQAMEAIAPAGFAFGGRFYRVQNMKGDVGGENNEGIYLVWDTLTYRYCIEKILCPVHVKDGRARREINTLDHLRDHPNITHLVHAECDELCEDPYSTIYTEYCDLGTLDNLLHPAVWPGGSIPESFLWHVLRSLAEAVRHLQQNGNFIYHRDIHPGNIFLASQPDNRSWPRVILGDFGCSTNDEDIEYGTADPSYVSYQDQNWAPPEAPHFGIASDIYQVGLVLSCLMFCTREPGGVIERLLEVENDKVYSSELRDIICGCLEPDIIVRFTIGDLIESLEPRAPVTAWPTYTPVMVPPCTPLMMQPSPTGIRDVIIPVQL